MGSLRMGGGVGGGRGGVRRERKRKRKRKRESERRGAGQLADEMRMGGVGRVGGREGRWVGVRVGGMGGCAATLEVGRYGGEGGRSLLPAILTIQINDSLTTRSTSSLRGTALRHAGLFGDPLFPGSLTPPPPSDRVLVCMTIRTYCF